MCEVHKSKQVLYRKLEHPWIRMSPMSSWNQFLQESKGWLQTGALRIPGLRWSPPPPRSRVYQGPTHPDGIPVILLPQPSQTQWAAGKPSWRCDWGKEEGGEKPSPHGEGTCLWLPGACALPKTKARSEKELNWYFCWMCVCVCACVCVSVV